MNGPLLIPLGQLLERAVDIELTTRRITKKIALTFPSVFSLKRFDRTAGNAQGAIRNRAFVVDGEGVPAFDCGRSRLEKNLGSLRDHFIQRSAVVLCLGSDTLIERR